MRRKVDIENHAEMSFTGSSFLFKLIDLLPAHIFWKNTDGVYLGCNVVFAQGLGFSSPDDVIGKTDYDFPVLSQSCERYRQDDNEVITSKAAKLNIEELQLFSSGKQAYLLTSKVPIFKNDNEVVGVLGVYSDITQEKNASRLAMQNELQERQLEGMSLLANSIAHELRTPLSGIGLGLNSLHQAIDILKPAYDYAVKNGYQGEKLSARLDRRLHNAIFANKNQVRAGLTYIDMMLANAKIGTISSDNFHDLSINEILQKVLEEYPFQDEKERRLVHIDVEIDFVFQGDVNYIRLVFFNLIKNALHFIKAANKGYIMIRANTSKEKSTIIFEDTAQGIKDDILKNIFERFYSAREGGSGIGLAFCKEVINAHKGHIHCESTFGEYTRFVIDFPKSNQSEFILAE